LFHAKDCDVRFGTDIQTAQLLLVCRSVDNGNGTSLISPVAHNFFADPSIYPLPPTAANANNRNAAVHQNRPYIRKLQLK
jgi:hypothetical protein